MSTPKAKKRLGQIGAIVAAVAGKWLDDRAPSMGAALAYYTAFSLAPLLVIVIAVAGLAVGHEGAQAAIVAQMRDLLGDAGGNAITGMLKRTSDLGHGTLALGVGVAALLLGATTAFAELEDDLDRIWRAEPRSANGLINMLRSRLLSFGMVLCVGFLLTVSLVVDAAIASLGQRMFGGTEAILQFLNLAASIAVTTILFAAIYKILPNVRIEWSDVWVGAFVTSVLFAIGRWLIGLYIGKSAVAATFGSAGPFVALMVWIYYSTQIFLLGAEFTYVAARGRAPAAYGAPARLGRSQAGSPITPDSRAHTSQRIAEPMDASHSARFVHASAAGLLLGWILTWIMQRARSGN